MSKNLDIELLLGMSFLKLGNLKKAKRYFQNLIIFAPASLAHRHNLNIITYEISKSVVKKSSSKSSETKEAFQAMTHVLEHFNMNSKEC